MNLSNTSPSFYLVSGERSDPREPTACWPKGRLRDSLRDDYMLVSIKPAIIGQKYGLAAKVINQVILSTRLAGATLYPITVWPCHVYVMRIKNESVLASHVIGNEDVEMISWGTLHSSEEDARRAAFS
jgi:hypothetical protein